MKTGKRVAIGVGIATLLAGAIVVALGLGLLFLAINMNGGDGYLFRSALAYPGCTIGEDSASTTVEVTNPLDGGAFTNLELIIDFIENDVVVASGSGSIDRLEIGQTRSITVTAPVDRTEVSPYNPDATARCKRSDSNYEVDNFDRNTRLSGCEMNETTSSVEVTFENPVAVAGLTDVVVDVSFAESGFRAESTGTAQFSRVGLGEELSAVVSVPRAESADGAAVDRPDCRITGFAYRLDQ